MLEGQLTDPLEGGEGVGGWFRKWKMGSRENRWQALGPFDNMKTDLCSLLLTMFIKKVIVCPGKRKKSKHKEFSWPLLIS